MSGPPYPRYAAGSSPGGNAIGSFIIGESPIGDVPPFDIWQTMISQYANSPIITALCTNMAQYVDPTADLTNFYDTIWNVDTAEGYGLDVWGRIVNVSRVVPIPTPVTQPYLGFEEAGTPASLTPFGQAPFFSGASSSNSVSLSDTAFRSLIFAKALANICDGSIPAINQLLLNIFPNLGNSYVADGLDLTMTYTFSSGLSQVQLAIVQSSGVIPRTSGVKALVSQP